MSQLRQNESCISFQVADVPMGEERLPEMSTLLALEKNAQARIVSCSNPEQALVVGESFQPLIAAAALSYQSHFPLVLYPDAIWLTILQGVAQHIANHPEALRSRMVAHQTRIEIVVEGPRVPQNDVEMLAATQGFLARIEKFCVPDKRFLLRAEFTNSTDLSRIATAVAFMDVVQPYFDYVFMVICGIPSITLEGTPEDWDLLGEKVRLLHESDLVLSWWTKHLLPICEHFGRASRGDVDPVHWGNLCKIRERYGVNDLNGWILKFVPYIRRDQNSALFERNPVLALEVYPPSKSWGDGDSMGDKITGCTSDMLPTGLSSAPVTVQEVSSGQTTPMQFLAGFTGVAQSPKDLSVRPQLGWAIAEQSTNDGRPESARERAETWMEKFLTAKRARQPRVS